MIIHGDCLEELKKLETNSIDSIVTDPPYGLKFMGKKWDYDVPSVEVWKECLRVLKPGGHLLSFAGTRTQHRMATNIEDAGFEIRDIIAWVYGSGFPKSLNIGKAVDKLQGNEREVIGKEKGAGSVGENQSGNQTFVAKNQYEDGTHDLTKGTSEWEGWGTALKPALEPITLARKPLSEKTVADNVLKYGTGGINIDESRVGGGREKGQSQGQSQVPNRDQTNLAFYPESLGRFPANLIHDGSEEVSKFLNDNQRFFYCAKASKGERNLGCEGLEEQALVRQGLAGEHRNPLHRNNHPTVKPLKLMEYLIRLVTPKNGKVLDPFTGSGTTGIACKTQGFNFIGIEREQEYVEIANARINHYA